MGLCFHCRGVGYRTVEPLRTRYNIAVNLTTLSGLRRFVTFLILVAGPAGPVGSNKH